MSRARTLIARHKLFQSVGCTQTKKQMPTRYHNQSRQSLYHTTERGCPRPCVLDVAKRGYPRLRSRAARSGNTRIRHPYRRRPPSPQHVSFFSLGDDADREESAAVATAAIRHSPRLSGICNIKLPKRSFSSHFVPTSAQFRSVSTTRRLNSLYRNASCTCSSLMLRCRTFPEPERVQVPLAAELSHRMSRRKGTPSWSGPHDLVELTLTNAQPQCVWRHCSPASARQVVR